jgi:hypothetical protein
MESTVGGNLTMRRRVWEEPARFLPVGGWGWSPHNSLAFISEPGGRGTLGEPYPWRRGLPKLQNCIQWAENAAVFETAGGFTVARPDTGMMSDRWHLSPILALDVVATVLE